MSEMDDGIPDTLLEGPWRNITDRVGERLERERLADGSILNTKEAAWRAMDRWVASQIAINTRHDRTSAVVGFYDIRARLRGRTP